MSTRTCFLISRVLLTLLTPCLVFGSSALLPDPEVVFGEQDNGIRYAILRNSVPQDRASIRMLVGAGSLDETEEERGLAHFLEHMAFNGTKNFPAEALVEWFQRNGMSFGGDSNAMTSFETTTYMLELPRGNADAIGEGLSVLRDFADGMLIEESEVDKERGVIIAEKQARDSTEMRTLVAKIGFLIPETLPPVRLPIGVDETIEAADAARLRGYYERWYRPDNIILVVVGDVEIDDVRRLIGENFASMQSEGELSGRTDRGTILPLEAPVAEIHREEEASAVKTSISVVAPWRRPADTVETRLQELPLKVANSIINRRLEKLAKKENAAFNSGTTSVADVFDFARYVTLELSGPPERWTDTLVLAEQEIRRALMHGFTEPEVEEIRQTMTNSLQEAVRSASTRRSPSLAGSLADALFRERIFTTPGADLEIHLPALKALTPDACVAALRAEWLKTGPRIFLSGAMPESVTPADVLDVFKGSQAVPVEAPVAAEQQPFAYTNFGDAGNIISKEHIPDLDIWLVRFENGLRLNLKQTDFAANSISFVARLGGGRKEIPVEEPEFSILAQPFLIEGGLGKHSREELRRLLAGRSANLNFRVAEDAFQFDCATTPRDLELSLQLLCAYLTDAGWRSDGLGVTRRRFTQYYEQLDHLVMGVAQTTIPSLLASGDPRFGLPPLEAALETQPSELAAWLGPILTNSELEVSIVGDIGIDEAIEITSRTIGALPARATPSNLDEAVTVRYPEVPPRQTFQVATEIPKALVQVYWPTADYSNIHTVRRLAMLASVVSDRLRKVVREELAVAYAPRSSNSSSRTFPGYGLFSVSVEVDPEATDKIREVILEIVRELQVNGVTDDELKRAREPYFTSIRQSLRENNYWLNSVLAYAQSQPQYLDYSRIREADFASITAEELTAFAVDYLQEERSAQFVVMPVAQ